MHYYLIGICGTAMASLAGILQAPVQRVTGIDENVYSPMSTMLPGVVVSTYDATRVEVDTSSFRE